MWNIGKTWYAYFKYTTRMGYVPPPRRLRYRTNLFVIWVWYKELMTYCCVIIMYLEVGCPVRVEIPKCNLQLFYGIMWTISLQLCSRLSRRNKLWCGRNALLTPISTWMRLEVESPLVWNLWILLPMGRQNLWIWILASWAAAGWASLVRMLFVPRLRGDGWIMIDDMRSWFERCFDVGCDVSSLVDFVWRKRIEWYEIAASFSEEVSQQGVLRPQSLWELQRNLCETTEKFMGAGFLE